MAEDQLFSGESKNIEYKVTVPDKSEKYMKTVVAFANGRGGRIVFGVDDKTLEIVGRAFCCSVRVALSFVSSRTTVTNDPPLSVPFAILCTVFSKNERLNAILIQHTGSLHRFFIFHNILFVNKQKQEKYICQKLHIEKSDCHPLS